MLPVPMEAITGIPWEAGQLCGHCIDGIQDIIHRVALPHLELHMFKKAFYIIG